MAKETTYQGKRGFWQRLSTALQANSELAHLEVQRASLMALYDQALVLIKQQGELMASKQEISKQLQVVMGEGERLATVLRLAVKAHYGIRSEKLAEFGLQPFRGRKRTEQPLPPPEDANPQD